MSGSNLYGIELKLTAPDGTSILYDPSLSEEEKTVIIPAVPADDDEENSLPYLGGGEKNFIPPNTAYANFRRPVSLRPPHSNDLLSFAGGEQAKKFFLNIHNASLSVVYKIQPRHPRLCMSFSVVDGQDDDKKEEEEADESSSFPSSLVLELEHYGEVSFKPANVWNSLYSMRQMNALVCRALHRWFRTHAATLPKQFRYQIKAILERRYCDKNWWNEKLDLTISFADADFNTKSDDMAFAVVKVGEALEGTGRFLEAAPIYETVAELLVAKQITNSSGEIDASMAFGFTGLAYKRGGDCVNGECYYVRGLYAHPNVLDFDKDGHLQVLILNLVNMYMSFPADLNASFAARTEEVHKSVSPNIPNMAQYLPSVFMGILYLVGYRSPPQGPGVADPVLQLGKNGTTLLKPKFRKIKVAKQALQELAKNGNDVEAWRGKLQSFALLDPNARYAVCSSTTDTIRPIDSIQSPAPRADTTSRRQSDKETARKAITDSKNCRCCNPTCAVFQEYTKFMRCPCHTVVYCGQKCQVEHWKSEHRSVCPTKGQKKKTKEAAPKRGKKKK